MKTFYAISITIIFLLGCNNISFKRFESNQGWLIFDYPAYWTQFEEEDGTYMFLDTNEWKGNFRITPLRIDGLNDDSISFNMDKNINDELHKHDGARLIKIGQKDVVFYSKEIVENQENLTILYWVFGQNKTIIIASFTIDSKRIQNKEIEKEILNCKKVLEIMKINN
jgi:hypothetical protein